MASVSNDDDGPTSTASAPRRLLVVKVPLDYVPVVAKADFGRIKPPYLELLENKDRVKDALKNQDYDVDLLVHPNPPSYEGSRVKVKANKNREDRDGSKSSKKNRDGRLITTSDLSSRLHVPRDREPNSAASSISTDSSRSSRSSSSSGSSRSSGSSGSDRSDRSDRSDKSDRSDRSPAADSDVDEYRQRVHDSYRDELVQQDKDRRDRARYERERYDQDEDHEPKPSRLDRIVGNDRFSRYVIEGGDRANLAPKIIHGRGSDRSDRDRDRDRDRSDRDKHMDRSDRDKSDRSDRNGKSERTDRSDRHRDSESAPTTSLPSLSQLQDGRSSNQARRVEMEHSKEQSAEKERTNLLMKLYRLKVAFPEGDIPPYSETTDTESLRKIFDQTRRKLHVNKDTEQYKQWSAMAHMALEYLLVNLMKMRVAKGLAEHHMRTAEKYNELLMELSDQQYNSGPSSWPVHWRLAGMVLFESAVFIGGNLLMTKLAGNMETMFNSMGSGARGTSTPQPQAQAHPPNMSGFSWPSPAPNSQSSSTSSGPMSGFSVHGPGQSGVNPAAAANITMEPPPIAFGTQPSVSRMSGPKLDMSSDKRKND